MSIGPGAILGGKYRLEDPIGRGGMGEVFEASSLMTGQRVAVKVVNRSFADTMLMERLRREAEAARRVQSEFVPQLYDVDKTPDGELFLVMELLHGETLASRLRRRGGLLTWEDVAHIGEDVLHGLIDAHAAGVVHRDLKPGNIFIEAMPAGRERARILDFGVCKLDVHDGESLTTTGEAVGTIAYMAPEQIRGASKVDERADLYAFAMVAFEALCGRLAYDANGSIALIAVKLEKPARSIRDLGRMPIPAGLDALLSRCLARRPADRPSSAAELLRDWRSLGPATIAPTPLPPGMELTDPATEAGLTAAPTQMTRTAKRGARIGMLVAAAALVASCGVLVAGLRLHASAAAQASETAVAETHPPPATATATVAAVVTTDGPGPAAPVSPPLEMAPVVLGAGTELPEAGAPTPAPRARGRGKRPWAQPGAPRRASTEPQIVAEPRY
ncbi:MAG TPA: protein kinase [Polyangiaceae bacterium]